MTIERLREAQRSEPFKPFTLRLADGRSFRVNHPEFLALPPKANDRTFLLFLESDDPDRESPMTILDSFLVVSLDFGEQGRNGQHNGQ